MSAARKKPSRLRLPRAEWLVGLTLLLVAGFLAVLTVLVVRQNADLHAQSADLHTANKARDALAAQVQSLGGKPVAGPPGSRGGPGKSVTGPRGGNGESGEPGSPGPSGSPGKNGDEGDNGAEGSAGESGPSGSPGTAGEQGAEGSQGEPGPAGPQGEPGPAGADGEDGTDGRDGKDGQTCPDGYSLQAPAADPDALVCRRDAAPNDGSDDEPTPQAAGLDPTRRQYT